ncbi:MULTISPECIES: 30S ribosomal protein S6 [Polycladomyces]|jgi:small subunit ribosomal protein S6|uniref:Small ribosomal subunit protein bS6 n=3 Tax=Polycladomyces TaxID=1348505 RepID=A0A8D5UKK6_9BACL|nr:MULTISPECIES: 30S ribosomal protein S6 [Polycladomyces]MBN2908155.1 30S ribosomal protein S6 [Polycladomyces sp. WAk]MDN4592568.1 30S ribosomal protein S6 [Polycladomyces subterraneus]BCU83395.1 30S ribosomal protein S6 [Polycladomyces abyssicola]
MRKYELMYIVRPDLDDENLRATREKVHSVITNNGGEIIEVNEMGKRRLAYEIKKFRDGVYTVVTFNATPEVVNELDRTIKINDNVIRHMIINLEEK